MPPNRRLSGFFNEKNRLCWTQETRVCSFNASFSFHMNMSLSGLCTSFSKVTLQLSTRSVRWTSNKPQMCWRPRLCPGSRWGSSWAMALPQTPYSRLAGQGGDTHLHIPPHSAPTNLRRSPCIPQNSHSSQSKIYACAFYVTYYMYSGVRLVMPSGECR